NISYIEERLRAIDDLSHCNSNISRIINIIIHEAIR
ncbi:MAG: hypothetical protein ACI93P_001827, partial [bacterium]